MIIRKDLKLEGREGFTVIEALISILLVTIIISMVSNVMVSGLHGYKRSKARLHMAQELELQKNQLRAKPFDNIELAAGDYSRVTETFTMRWKIVDLSPTLKKIHLFLLYTFENTKVAKRLEFFKSKYNDLVVHGPPIDPGAVE